MSRTITLAVLVIGFSALTLNNAQANRFAHKKVYTTVSVPGYLTQYDLDQCSLEVQYVRSAYERQAEYEACLARKRAAKATTRVVVSTRPVVTPLRHVRVRRPAVVHSRPAYNKPSYGKKPAATHRPGRSTSHKAPARTSRPARRGRR